jgi:hypothetical protein
VTVFSVSPAVLPGPGEVILEWGTSNSLAVGIERIGTGPLEDVTPSGKRTIFVRENSVFVISAQGAGGSDLRAVAVTVQAKASSVLLTAVPSTIDAGGSSTLVWNAPEARSVRLEAVGGAAVDVMGQTTSGSIRVSPRETTTYRLLTDDVVSTVTVRVAPTITVFAATNSPGPGEPLTLRWETASATSVSLRRVGVGMPLPIPMGQVATGSLTDTVPTTLPADGVLTYVLEATDGTLSTTRALEVVVGGGVQIGALTVPRYALIGSTYDVLWRTSGAESVDVMVDGQRVYQAPTLVEVTSGRYSLPAPTQSSRIEVIARNRKGGEARESRTVDGVGPLTYNSFVADKNTIGSGGEPVTLRWSVLNARRVRITNNLGGGFYREFEGPIDSGSLVVLPNARAGISRVTYRLEAENGTGSPPIVRTLDVTVSGSAALTFSRQLPVNAPTTVTGSTAPGTTLVAGFRAVEKNPPQEAFIDIRKDGTPISFGSLDAALITLPQPFEATLFGTRFSRTTLNVSRFGWFSFPVFAFSPIPGRPENAPQLQAFLEPHTIAPYWNNLETASNQVHFRLDAVPDARRLIVQWTNVRPKNGPIDARLSFQAQLYSNGKVVFAYRDFFKVQVQGTVGITNNSETDEATPPMPVASGDVYRFFAPTLPPAPLRIEATPYAGTALINGVSMEVEGAANYPVNQFAVSEVNYRPAANVTNGQWIEVGNNSDASVDLGGWDLDFGGTATYQIPSGTTLPPFGKVLLAQASDLGDPDGADAGGFALPDGGFEARRPPQVIYPMSFVPPSSGAFVRISIGGTEYARFPNTNPPSTLPLTLPLGQSYQVEDFRAPWVTYETATTRFICGAVRGRYGTKGQRGTPGGLNPSCFPYEAPVPSSTVFQSLADAGTAVTPVGFDGMSPNLDDGTAFVTLNQPIRVYGASITQLSIGANGGVIPIANATLSFSNKSTPNAFAPAFVIAPFWDDLHGGRNPNSRLFWKQDTNGDVTVSWENWSLFSSSNVSDLNFQAILRANGDVEFVFGTMSGAGPSAADARGLGATTWIDIGPAAAAININSTTPGITPNTAFRYVLSENL